MCDHVRLCSAARIACREENIDNRVAVYSYHCSLQVITKFNLYGNVNEDIWNKLVYEQSPVRNGSDNFFLSLTTTLKQLKNASIGLLEHKKNYLP